MNNEREREQVGVGSIKEAIEETRNTLIKATRLNLT